MAKKSEFKKSELSAAERKAKRRGTAETDIPSGKTSRRIAAWVLFAFALIMVATGTIIPIYLNTGYRNYENPVAVIELAVNGKTEKLEYEIFAKEAPIASANFMYLASKGFFDNVIVYDNSSNWIKFGGYTASGYAHKADDDAFLRTLNGDFSLEKITDKNALKYKLNTDNYRDLDYKKTNFVLTSNVTSSRTSATEFQISCSLDNGAPVVNGYRGGAANATNNTLTVECFGRPLRTQENLEKTAEVLKYIAGLETDPEVTTFKTPLAGGEKIIITAVKVYNYEAAWKDVSLQYGFESYMRSIGGFYSEVFDASYILPVQKEE